MKRMGMVLAAAAVVALTAGTASAQKKVQFDDVARKAKPVAGLWGLGALLWTQLGSCKSMTNDLERRQCEGVQQRRSKQIGGKTFLFTTDSSPLRVEAYNAKKKSAEISLTPCLACSEAIEIDGKKLHVTGQGSVKVSGGAISAAPLHSTSQTFKDQAAFDKWKKEVLPRMKTEFVVKVDDAKKWSKSGANGMAVEVVAYRSYDPCTGAVVACKPTSAKMSGDARACGEKEKKKDPVEPEKVVEKPEPKGPVLPHRLSPFQINMAMGPVRKQQNKCFDAYGVPGKGSFKITISNEGKVSDVKQTGDFVDTPTGKCIEKSIRGVQFKKFKKKSITFDFPVVLQ
jgi:hypothetical protein